MQFSRKDIPANFKSKRKTSVLQVKEKTIDVEYLKKIANRVLEIPDLNPNNFMYLVMGDAVAESSLPIS